MLAALLGSTVEELQGRMGYSEFMEWAAYHRVEPLGPVRGDVQAALIAALFANTHRDAKKRNKPFGLADFVPTYWREERDDGDGDGASLLDKFRAIFQA